MSTAMQLSGTVPKVPQDLFLLKMEREQERLSQAGKQESGPAASQLMPARKRHADSELTTATSTAPATEPSKRKRVMTARMLGSSAQLSMLRHSLAPTEPPASG